MGRGKGGAGGQKEESFGDHLDVLLMWKTVCGCCLEWEELVCRELGYVGVRGAWRQLGR